MAYEHPHADWPHEHYHMNIGEKTTADEVIDQYDLLSSQEKEARRLINEEAMYAPFNAYNTAHRVCAKLKGGI